MTDEQAKWIGELRDALDAKANNETIKTIADGRIVPDSLRCSYWKVLLFDSSSDAEEEPDEKYSPVCDLEEQSEISSECNRIAELLCGAAEDSMRIAVQKDLESIITLYCKSTKRRFDVHDNWTSVLRVIWTVEKKKQVAYKMFVAILARFLPKDGYKTTAWGSLFRLLLLYHEPELCNFLDSKRLLPESYVMHWFCSLFASSCELNVTLSLWDIYLHSGDQFGMFFFALVLLVYCKSSVLESRDASREELATLLEQPAKRVAVCDLEDFSALMSAYSSSTPASFRELFAAQLFREAPAYTTTQLNTPSKRHCNVENFFCLPLVCTDVFDLSKLQLTGKYKFLFVDCRPEDQYERSGAIPNAFRFNAVLMLQDPTTFNERMNALLALVEQASEVANENHDLSLYLHVCFCSSGFPIEDSYSNMLIAHCLQRKMALVSTMYGGMRALHDAPSLQRTMLNNHDEQSCSYCHPPFKLRGMPMPSVDDAGDETESQSQTRGATTITPRLKAIESAATSLFGRLSGVVKQTTYKMAESRKWALGASISGAALLDASNYISELMPTREKQPSAADASSTSTKPSTGRTAPYRDVGTKVFSIDDDNDDDDASINYEMNSQLGSDALKREEVNLETWLHNKPDVRHSFACHLVLDNGFLVDSHLLVTDSHFFILRHQTTATAATPWWRFTAFGSDRALMAVIHSRQPIRSVVKITSRRTMPELITFHYAEKVAVTDVDGQNQVQIRSSSLDRLIIPNAIEVVGILTPLIITAVNTNTAERKAAAATDANIAASTSGNNASTSISQATEPGAT